MEEQQARESQADLARMQAVRGHALARETAEAAGNTHRAMLNEGIHFATSSRKHLVGARKQSTMDQVKAIPDKVLSLHKPLSAKPVLQPPPKWQINDALTRDPPQFIEDVCAYAVQTGQEAVGALRTHMEPSMRQAASDIFDAAGAIMDEKERTQQGLPPGPSGNSSGEPKRCHDCGLTTHLRGSRLCEHFNPEHSARGRGRGRARR
mmetsp:Transcript_8372/g.22371  ORF Transcript_8372/g.22371 Transcript_8372/m.22371 type:complete len:207 (-) Transcript_8372:208-828(-)